MAARGGRAAAAPQGPGGVNIFANDGSFLELFKRKMEAEQRGREAPAQGGQEAAAAAGTVGPGEEPVAGAAPGDSGTEQQRPPEGKKRSGSALSFEASSLSEGNFSTPHMKSFSSSLAVAFLPPSNAWWWASGEVATN
ncbi:telomerase RNA component interacting RNase isoform X3 [Lepidochelys kempii]|uniref:telomerase RNA component interacting RNase isoform X3 n=1 Tax=Lepidochelys kempii TaxID=8472 RepID=UPI003C6FE3AF